MRRLLIVLTVVTLVTALAAAAWTQPEGRGCGICPPDGGMERLHHGGSCGMGRMGGTHGLLGRAEELGLTQEQIEKIRALAADWAVKRVDRTAVLQKARLQLAEALGDGDVDMEKVEKRLETVLQAQKNLNLGQIRYLAEVRGVLTEEQRGNLGPGVMGCPMMGSQGMRHGRGMRCGGGRCR